MKHKAIVVDLDNTLAMLGERHPYDGHLCETDALCPVVGRTISAFREDHWVIFLTGRSSRTKSATKSWLARHGLSEDILFMREDGDWRTGAEYKAEVMRERILPKYEVVLALDDDPDIVSAFRSMGVRTWWVNDYDPALPERRHLEETDGDY